MATVFYENHRQDVPVHHNMLLYVTAWVREVELRRAMVEKLRCLEIELQSSPLKYLMLTKIQHSFFVSLRFLGNLICFDDNKHT